MIAAPPLLNGQRIGSGEEAGVKETPINYELGGIWWRVLLGFKDSRTNHWGDCEVKLTERGEKCHIENVFETSISTCGGVRGQMRGCLLFTGWWLYKVGDKSYECRKQSPTQYYGQLGLFIPVLLAQSQTPPTLSPGGEMYQAPDTQVPALSTNMANRQQKVVGNLRIAPPPPIYLWMLRELWEGSGAWTSHLPPSN